MWHSQLPWNLGQVCRQWKDIALSTSALWTRIPNIDLDASKTFTASYAEYLSEILRRSHLVPVYMQISGEFIPTLHDSIINIVVSNSERICALKLQSGSIMPALKGMKGRLSSLERLTLDLNRKFEEALCDLFETASLLSDVYVRIHTSSSKLALPFHQIRRYEESAWNSSSIGKHFT